MEDEPEDVCREGGRSRSYDDRLELKRGREKE
jgi:hypothetical protein